MFLLCINVALSCRVTTGTTSVRFSVSQVGKYLETSLSALGSARI